MGDGSLNSTDNSLKGSHHDIRFYPDDLTMANLFIEAFEKLYLKKPSIKNLGRYFRLHISSKPAWQDLNKFGEYDSLNWTIPRSFLSKEEKIEWLRSLFDCEAYVDVKKKRIVFQTVSKKGINSIQKLLDELGIKSKYYIYKRKNLNFNLNYLLFVSRFENISRFSEMIGFNHLRKKKKLDYICRCARKVNGAVSKTVARKGA